MNKLTAGQYVRLRRETAGFSLDEVALMISDGQSTSRNAARISLEKLEGNDPDTEYLGLVWRLVHVFKVDPHLYLSLVGFDADPKSELPRPRICLGCGCTWTSPCQHDGGEPCRWIGDFDLCSACEPAPPLPAEAVETRHAA